MYFLVYRSYLHTSPTCLRPHFTSSFAYLLTLRDFIYSLSKLAHYLLIDCAGLGLIIICGTARRTHAFPSPLLEALRLRAYLKFLHLHIWFDLIRCWFDRTGALAVEPSLYAIRAKWDGFHRLLWFFNPLRRSLKMSKLSRVIALYQ